MKLAKKVLTGLFWQAEHRIPNGMRCKRCFVCFSQSKSGLANLVHVAGQVEHLVGEAPLVVGLWQISKPKHTLSKR